jgi:hypothetical protein
MVRKSQTAGAEISKRVEEAVKSFIDSYRGLIRKHTQLPPFLDSQCWPTKALFISLMAPLPVE